MEFSAKFDKQDFEDLATLVRPRFYWPRLLLGNIHGAVLLGAIFWLGVSDADITCTSLSCSVQSKTPYGGRA